MNPDPAHQTPPSLADLEAHLAYELAAAQIHALRALVAISQDLSNPKEARAAATAILKFKLPTPLSAAGPDSPERAAPALPSPETDSDAALDAELADAAKLADAQASTTPTPTPDPSRNGHPGPAEPPHRRNGKHHADGNAAPREGPQQPGK